MGHVNALDIAQFLGMELIGDNLALDFVSSCAEPVPHTVIFSSSSFNLPQDAKNLVLCTPQNHQDSYTPPQSSYILCSNPRLMFAKVAQHFFVNNVPASIHDTAVIAENTNIHPSVSIGAYCVIESGVSIGEGTLIQNHVVISKNVSIGKKCYIKSGAVIGEEGFGFDFEEDKTPVRLPHVGSVEIEDCVEIGAKTTIARGTISNTVIKSNTKIDDQVHIAHNCIIDKKTIITASAELSGSVHIGEGAWVGPNAAILQKIYIGDFAVIGIGATVTDNVPAHKVVAGVQALPLKTLAALRRIIKKNQSTT